MAGLDELKASAGKWTGKSRLEDPHTQAPDESASTAVLGPILGGRFIRLDYTWSYKNSPQEGSLLIGHDPATGTVSAYWIDTWHNGEKVMASIGSVGTKGEVNVVGSYPAPPGPDWGWRISIMPAADKLRIIMHNIDPDGNEYLAVEAQYARA